jgi:opacity protein-like surface antigen
MSVHHTLGVLLLVVAAASPVSAQTFFDELPPVSVRPFLLVSGERFTASETFDTVFGQTVQPLWGGGVQLSGRSGFFIDFTVSRFKKTGERAFFFEGEGFRLGIPMTVTLTPIEFSAGGRFRQEYRLVPYVGAGVGSYGYKESSDFDDGTFEKRHVGYLVVGGADFRITRWIAVSGDVQYTHVPGIIGSGGVSQEADEDNLGGTAVRFRLIFGR